MAGKSGAKGWVYRDVVTICAESRNELWKQLRADEHVVFAQTTGGDGHTANDTLFDMR